MQSKINWLKSDTNTWTKTERGYLATITVDSTGTATLVVTYPVGSPPVALPSSGTFTTIKNAKASFLTYLRGVSVAVGLS